MTDFTRANGGAPFGVETFTPDDANAFRTNDELLFRVHATRLAWTELDYTSLDPEAIAAPGPLVWNERMGAYTALSLKTGPTEDAFATLLAVGPNSMPFLSRLPATPADYPSGTSGNVVLTGNPTTGTYTALFTSAATPANVVIADSVDLSTWTTRVASSGPFAISSANPCRMTNAITVVPGAVTTTAALMFVNNTAAGVYTVAIGNGPASSTVRKIATNGTIVVGVCSTGATGIHCTNVGVVSSLSMPFHADANGNASLIAYDARAQLFARLAVGAASPNLNALYYATSANGTTWSATAGWRRVQLPSLSTSISLVDFSITPDGLWLVLFRHAGSLGESTTRLAYSIDAGANWAVQSFGTFFDQDSEVAAWRLASPGPGLVAVRQDSASILGVLTGGMRSTGTEIAATVVS